MIHNCVHAPSPPTKAPELSAGGLRISPGYPARIAQRAMPGVPHGPQDTPAGAWQGSVVDSGGAPRRKKAPGVPLPPRAYCGSPPSLPRDGNGDRVALGVHKLERLSVLGRHVPAILELKLGEGIGHLVSHTLSPNRRLSGLGAPRRLRPR